MATSPQATVVDDLDLNALAELFPSAAAICEALVGYPGSYTMQPPSSLTDQQRACFSAAESGAAQAATLIAVAGTVSAAGILWYLARKAQERTRPPWTGPGDPPPSSEAPDGDPPAPVRTHAMDLADHLMARNNTLTKSEAEVIARQCIWMMEELSINGRRECGGHPIFVSGYDVLEAARHDLKAIATNPAWARLNYEHAAAKEARLNDRQWYGSEPECQPGQEPPENVPPLSCDGHPFYSTEQGGSKAVLSGPGRIGWRAHLERINFDDNKQGDALGGFGIHSPGFYVDCGLRTGVPQPGANSTGGDPFLHVPLTKNVLTLWVCG